MIPDFWQKQSSNSPLYEDILWSRPENRLSAGKLLVMGGNDHGFAAVAEAFAVAEQTGAGVVRAVLPDSLQKTVGPALAAEFAPSTPSGSLAKMALNELLIQSNWADAVLIAGDLGRNSETSALLESYVQKHHGLLTITKDAVDYFYHTPELVAEREQTTLVLSLAQLQKLGMALKFDTPFLLSMGMLLLVQALHDFTEKYPVTIVTKELDNIIVAHNGQVSSTKLRADMEIWRVKTAAAVSVFWMQNPSRPYEAITSSII